jgi:hypothetical protein
MDQKTKDLRQSLIFRPNLPSAESQRNYRQLAAAIRDHIRPQNILEEIWTSEIIEGDWEIVRLRRYKGQIVNLDKLVSLRNLLQLILPHASDVEIDDLARRRFTNKEIRKQVDTLLHSIDLDASAIDIESFRSSIAAWRNLRTGGTKFFGRSKTAERDSHTAWSSARRSGCADRTR